MMTRVHRVWRLGLLGSSLAALVALMAAGCGGGRSLSPRERAKLTTKLSLAAEVADRVGSPAPMVRASSSTSPRRARRSRSLPRVRPQGPAVHVKVSVHHMRMFGGTWIAPPGATGARGRAVLTLYGDSRFCWRVGGLHSLGARPDLLTLDQGMVARGTRDTTISLLSIPYRAHGCSPAPARILAPIVKDPKRYMFAIGTTLRVWAVAGQL